MNQIVYTTAYCSFIVMVISIVLMYKRARIDGLFFFLIASLFIGITSLVLGKLQINNLPLLHLFTLMEYVLLSIWYYRLMSKNTHQQRFLKYFSLITTALIILNSIFIQSIFSFNTYAKTLAHFCLLINPVLFYLDRMNQEVMEEFPLGLLIINTAVIVYYGGSLFIFMTSAIFSGDTTEYSKLPWVINAVMNLVFQLLIMIGIWKMQPIPKN